MVRAFIKNNKRDRSIGMVIKGLQMIILEFKDLVVANYPPDNSKVKGSLTKKKMSRLREKKREIEEKIKDRQRLQRQERNRRYYKRTRKNNVRKKSTRNKSSAGLGTILKYFHEKIQSD